MRKVPLPEVEDGMVLAKPLTGSSGNVLMGKGIALRTSIIPRLAAWGVTHVYIDGEPSADELALSQGENKIDASLEKLFVGKTENNGMKVIFQCLTQHRSRHVNG